MAAPPSDADPAATTDAAGRPAHHPVTHAAMAPERRRPWTDLLRLVLKYVGDGVRQLLRRLMLRKNLEEPHGADLVVDDLLNENGPDASREECDDAGVVVNRDLAESEREERKDGHVADQDARKTVTNINVDKSTAVKKNLAWQYQNRRRRAIPFVVCCSDEQMHRDDPASQVSDTSTVATPASPLRVDGEPVWGEELRLFASYCQESLTCTKKILCHMCIFEPHMYCRTDKFAISTILLHSVNVHETPGLECKTCKVRVRTPRELLLHAHFCHALKTGWWKLKLYNDKMKVTKAD